MWFHQPKMSIIPIFPHFSHVRRSIGNDAISPTENCIITIFRQGVQNSDLHECADIHVNLTECYAVADEERQARWMKRLGKLHPV